jgi:hypothetical protein
VGNAVCHHSFDVVMGRGSRGERRGARVALGCDHKCQTAAVYVCETNPRHRLPHAEDVVERRTAAGPVHNINGQRSIS